MSNENEEKKAPFVMVLDEFGSYFGDPSDSVRRELRDVPGVPNASYLVNDGKVFVFEKLLQLVELNKQSTFIDNKLQSGPVLALLNSSWVSPLEAVTAWNITPVPFRVADGQITHEPFNANIPSGNSVMDTAQALALLLVGGVVEGEGDFSFRGQPMTLIEAIDISALPPRPDLTSPFEQVPNAVNFRRLAPHKYVAGFEPISPEIFGQALEAEQTWTHDTAQANAAAYKGAQTIWAQVKTIPLVALNDTRDQKPDDDELENLQALVSLYPELEMLTPETLYDLFGTFQSDCYYMNSWTPDRDDDFLFFLLGRLVLPGADGYKAREMGQIAGFLLLRGEDWQGAKACSLAWGLYDAALTSLAHRVARAMDFLERSNAATDLRGGEITTILDVHNNGRKWSVDPIIVTQSLEDLKPK